MVDSGNTSLFLDSKPMVTTTGGVVSPSPSQNDSVIVSIGGVADLTSLTNEGEMSVCKYMYF